MGSVKLTDESKADAVERAWIDRYRAQGTTLRNAPGYQRGRRPDPGTDDEAWIAVRVPKEAREELKRWADQEERSISWIVRRLILDAAAQRRTTNDRVTQAGRRSHAPGPTALE